jgi:hypothetical protein
MIEYHDTVIGHFYSYNHRHASGHSLPQSREAL